MGLIQKQKDDLFEAAKRTYQRRLRSITNIVKYNSGTGFNSERYEHWNPNTGWDEICAAEINDMKKDTELKKIVDSAPAVVQNYLPWQPYLVHDEKNLKSLIMNTWTSPDMTYKETTVHSLPEIYADFFSNLFAFREDAERVLDWIAGGLRKKLQKYLYLVATGGEGKGILTEIISALHLPKNSFTITNKDLGSNFDGYLEGKTFICLDEPNATSPEIKNKLKTYINSTMRTESKGKDSKNITAHFNLMITGNLTNGILLDNTSADLRRYYCPQLKKKPLHERVKDTASYREKLLDKENLTKFYWWLKNREVKTDFTQNIVTDHHRKLIGESAPQWLQQVVEELLTPRLNTLPKIYLKDIQEWIRDNSETMKGRPVGKNTIKTDLERFYSDRFTFKENNKNKGREKYWVEKILPQNNPHHFEEEPKKQKIRI